MFLDNISIVLCTILPLDYSLKTNDWKIFKIFLMITFRLILLMPFADETIDISGPETESIFNVVVDGFK